MAPGLGPVLGDPHDLDAGHQTQQLALVEQPAAAGLLVPLEVPTRRVLDHEATALDEPSGELRVEPTVHEVHADDGVERCAEGFGIDAIGLEIDHVRLEFEAGPVGRCPRLLEPDRRDIDDGHVEAALRQRQRVPPGTTGHVEDARPGRQAPGRIQHETRGLGNRPAPIAPLAVPALPIGFSHGWSVTRPPIRRQNQDMKIRPMSRPLLSLPLLASLVLVLASGEPSAADEVELNGGTRLAGVVLSESEEQVRLLTEKGDVLLVARGDVKQVARDRAAPQAGQFLRYVAPAAGKPGGLDVATTWYEHPKGGPRVALVGVVHIAEKSFFRELMQVLERNDVVLYEGVKGKDQDASTFQQKSKEGENPIRDLQGKLAKWFDLAFQLDEIEYTRPHFVHADATPEELGIEMPAKEGDAEAGDGDDEAEKESTPSIPGLPGAGGQDPMAMIKSLGPMLDQMMANPSTRNMMKRTFAQVMGSGRVDQMMTQMMPGMSEVLLTRRNKIVVTRLAEQLKKDVDSIAIFYGAAHNGDLEKRMIEELGYKRAGAKWYRAWHLD